MRENLLPKALLPFVWHFLKSYKLAAVICSLLSIIAGFWGTLNSILLKRLVDLLPGVANGDVTILIFPASLVIINFTLLDNLTWRLIDYIWAKYVPIVQNMITAQTLDYTFAHSHRFYQNNSFGRISKQISNLVDGITRLITLTAVNFLRSISLLLSAFVAAYFVNAIFCVILIVWFVVFACFSIAMSKRLVALSDGLAEEEATVTGELIDSLSNYSNVRIFSRRLYETARMIPFFDKQRKAYTKTYLYAMRLSCVQGGLIAMMMAISIFFLVYLYGKSLVTIGDFILILDLSMETGNMMWWTIAELDEFNKAVGRCKQSLISLISPIEILDKPCAMPFQFHGGQITFDSVEFHYQNVGAFFENESIKIAAGQKVGLVGYSGSGKSTFVNLILRLYDVMGGAILIDGQDIRNITQDSLYESIAVMPQDPMLFHRSVMENIRYGRIGATDEEVVEAAKKACAHGFIEKLPDGYDSLVGDRGAKLSGGQRQRIAIARAILKCSPILIIDEATSQIDSITEKLIQEFLWKFMQNKTTIIIDHRLSHLLHMDRILVFDKGSIVEDGTHNELLAKNGLYKRLWDAQICGF